MAESHRKIKIAYFIQDLHTGGAEKLLLDLIAHLDPARFEILLITMHNKGELFAHLPAAVCKTYCTANPVTLYKILRRKKPDVVHTHLWRADLLGVPVARLAGVGRVISTRHNINYFQGLKIILVPWDILAMRMAHTVIAISKAVRDFYLRKRLYQKVKFEIIPNGVDLSKYSATEPCCKKLSVSAETSTVNILTVATLKRKKGHVPFLEILKQLTDVDFVWHLVGDGPEKSNIQRKAEQLNLLDRIRFHGTQENTVPFYQQADVFALPSLWEGMPLVLLEAAAAGVPMIASDIETIREIIEDGKTGLLFDIHNPAAAASKIKPFLQNAQQRAALADCAQKNIANFSIGTMVERYMKLYGSV